MSRHDNWEAEDGMGFAGLVPTLAEKRREQEEERERELIAALRESLASAQRGKEAAERELEEAKQSMAFKDQLIETLMVKRPLGRKIEQLQQERDRLSARLDAAEKFIEEVRDTVSSNYMGGYTASYIRSRTLAQLKHLDAAISSSPSTSAVPEKEEAK